jgi:hypothetical protein
VASSSSSAKGGDLTSADHSPSTGLTVCYSTLLCCLYDGPCCSAQLLTGFSPMRGYATRWEPHVTAYNRSTLERNFCPLFRRGCCPFCPIRVAPLVDLLLAFTEVTLHFFPVLWMSIGLVLVGQSALGISTTDSKQTEEEQSVLSTEVLSM